MHLKAEFAIGYGLGILALTKVVKVPLRASTCISLHVGAFVVGVLATLALELRS